MCTEISKICAICVLFLYFSKANKTQKMKKILYLLPVFIFGCKSNNAVVTEIKQPSEITYKVSQQDVSKTLEFLTCDELEGRDPGSKSMEKAVAFLEDIYKKNNVKPYFISYRDTLSNFDKTAYNVVGVIEGNDPKLKNEFVVIGAHYDHIGIDEKALGDKINNGANDNASGTTAVTEVIKYFAKNKTNKRSILFAFFSAEEKGLLGSKHLAKKLKEKNFNIYTMLNFEMIGVPMKRDFTAYITGYGKSNMASKFNEYAEKNLIGFLQAELTYRLFMASDNYPFFTEFNVPAQTVCTFDFENYEYYHKPQDEFKLMDTAHMASFVQEMLPVIVKMTNSETKEIALKK